MPKRMAYPKKTRDVVIWLSLFARVKRENLPNFAKSIWNALIPFSTRIQLVAIIYSFLIVAILVILVLIIDSDMHLFIIVVLNWWCI